MLHKRILLCVLVAQSIFAVSCTGTKILPSITPSPTSYPTDTSTPTYSPSPKPPTPTRVPPTKTITLTPPLKISNTPITSWKGIPIMPGAYGIQVDNENVIFKTKSGKTDVRAYYNRELKKLGYSQVGYSEGGKGFLDFYEKGEDMVSITIADDFSDSSTTLVIIG